jgi:hypothetical protein
MVDVHQSPGAFRREQHDTAGATNTATAPGADIQIPVLVSTEPRLLTEYDIPWLNFICKKRYSNRYDSGTTENWFRNIVLKSPLTFYATRLEHAFQITMLSVMPWTPAEPEAIVLFVCADDGKLYQAVKLMRDSIEWSRKRRCAIWRLSSDTDIELVALAKRLGVTEISPRYCIRF